MFEVGEKDYVPLEDYLFGWRWTDAHRAEISAEHRARIRPLTEEKAEDAWDYAKAFQGKSYWARFREVDAFEVDGRGEQARDEGVQGWLRERLPSEQETVFLSWTQRQAVETDRDTLITYWDTFCYPVEDVVIWPRREHWVLLFDYKQRFYYAEERAEGET